MATAWASSYSNHVPVSYPPAAPKKNGLVRHLPVPDTPRTSSASICFSLMSPSQHKARLMDQAQILLSGEETSDMLYETKKFEMAVEQYLSVTPHERKFGFAITAELFQKGIVASHFNAQNFIIAWENLSRYAINLLSKPWRSEYRTVKLYCGFYRHFIQSQLPEGYRIFALMGYSMVPSEHNSVLRLTGPIDPDIVLPVYLDCIIAAVECDVMLRIFDRVKDLHVTWEEVIVVREKFICDVEEASKIIRQEYYERQAREMKELELGPFSPRGYAVPVNNSAFYHGTLFHNPGFSFEAGGSAGARSPGAMIVEQLVDIDPVPVPSGRGSRKLPKFPLVEEPTPPPRSKPSHHHHHHHHHHHNEPDSSSESWSYVYDALGLPSDPVPPPPPPPAPVQVQVPASLPAPAPAPIPPPKPEKKSPRTSDVITALKSFKFSDRDKVDGIKSSKTTSSKQDKLKWSCHACTYLNPPEAQICTMCSKSRRKGAEEKPLSVGGKECLRCTYVNDKDVDECVICQDSLNNCPTYT